MLTTMGAEAPIDELVEQLCKQHAEADGWTYITRSAMTKPTTKIQLDCSANGTMMKAAAMARRLDVGVHCCTVRNRIAAKSITL